VDEVLAPLKELKLLEPTMRRTFGTDHASFNEVGVPGFFVVQDSAEYNQTHHSQSDTFDKVWKDDLNQGAQVLAAWAYNTAATARDVAAAPAALPAIHGRGEDGSAQAGSHRRDGHKDSGASEADQGD